MAKPRGFGCRAHFTLDLAPKCEQHGVGGSGLAMGGRPVGSRGTCPRSGTGQWGPSGRQGRAHGLEAAVLGGRGVFPQGLATGAGKWPSLRP